jgi:hypothetical protein
MSDLINNTSNVVNIKHFERGDNLIVEADYYQIPFYKKEFFDSRDYVKFIKAAEKLIRTSDDYKHYIGYLKNEIGLNHCMIMPNIDDEKADIEMHHGPILTLFDYCDIVMNYYLNQDKGLTTFDLAEIILQEHFDNNVQVVMLSKSAHQLIHTGNLFINPSQAWGNLNRFLEKYDDGISDEQREVINNYILLSEKNKSTDNGYLSTDSITSWDRDKKQMKEFKKIIGKHDYQSYLEDELFN